MEAAITAAMTQLTEAITTIAPIVLTAIAGIWVYKVGIKMVNRGVGK